MWLSHDNGETLAPSSPWQENPRVQLPGRDRAVIEPAKLQDYLLSSTHPIGRFKAVLFFALGYTADNWQVLRDDLLELARTNEATPGAESPHGEKFEVRATLTGPNGRAADIVTVWIVRSAEVFPRFVTAYPSDAP